MTTLADILAAHDAGEFPDAIALQVGVTPGYVYKVLREARPDRKRKPRRRGSELTLQIRGLLAAGIKPRRVAELLECSRTYVYRVHSDFC